MVIFCQVICIAQTDYLCASLQEGHVPRPPETSSLKTSFQEKVSLQHATGMFHSKQLSYTRVTVTKYRVLVSQSQVLNTVAAGEDSLSVVQTGGLCFTRAITKGK